MNGVAENYSPDSNLPVIITDKLEKQGLTLAEFEVIEELGGGEVEIIEGRYKFYKLPDGDKLHIKRSKFYPRHEYYWYGISPRSLERSKDCGVTHILFIMGEEGFVIVPISIVEEFSKETRTSIKEDGTIRHYHLLFSTGPEPELYFSQELPKYSLVGYFHVLKNSYNI